MKWRAHHDGAQKVFLSGGSKLKKPSVQNQRVPDSREATLSRSCPRAGAGWQGMPMLGRGANYAPEQPPASPTGVLKSKGTEAAASPRVGVGIRVAPEQLRGSGEVWLWRRDETIAIGVEPITPCFLNSVVSRQSTPSYVIGHFRDTIRDSESPCCPTWPSHSQSWRAF